MARPVVRDLEHLSGFFLDPGFEQVQPGGHPLHESPMPNRPFVDCAKLGKVGASSPSAPYRRIAQFGAPTPHRHSQIAGGFGQEPVGINELAWSPGFALGFEMGAQDSCRPLADSVTLMRSRRCQVEDEW